MDYTMQQLLDMEDERLIREAELEERRKLEEKEKQKREAELKQKQALEEKRLEKERRENTFEDKKLVCKKCGEEWIWTASEQKFFKEKGFFKPSMCKKCRSSIKTINNFHK